jgi:outer membrane lipoprotein-sorting protein
MSSNGRAISRLEDAARALTLALVLTGTAGCALREVSRPSPNLPLDAAAGSLANRDRLLTSLQTPAIMDYSGPSGHLKAREQLTVRRPASLRVDAMSPLGIALIVAADDAQMAVFNPSTNTLMRGAPSAETLAHFIWIPMAPAQAVQLLLALAPDHSILAARPFSSRTQAEMRILSYAADGARSYELGFSGGQLVLVRARDGSGQATYEVRYSNYRDIGAMKFPFEVEARFFASATTIKFHYLNPSIDRWIADSTFVLSPKPGTKVIDFGFAVPSTFQASPG